MRTAEETRLARNVASAAWRARNPGHQARVTKEWRDKNPGAALIAVKAWQEANTERYAVYKAAYAKQYNVERRRTDPLFKLLGNTRSLINISFKLRGWGKTAKTQKLLGCTFEEFAAHLQKQFKEGMTLENHGDWHIDHIKPCATATSAEELAALFHFTNLQPLWGTENLSKGSKYYG